MTTQLLKEYLTLVKAQNFTAAAEELFISQSSLSRHVIGLEKELNTTLLVRNGKGFDLTEDGYRLLKYAEQVSATQQSFIAKAEKKLNEGGFHLTIGCDSTLDCYNITEPLGQLIVDYPQMNISVVEGTSEALLEKVKKGEVDVAIVFLYSNSENPDIPLHVKTMELVKDPLAILLPLNHPKSNENNISLYDLKNETFVFQASQPVFRSVCNKACLDCGFSPQRVYENMSGDVVYDLVAQGKCITMGWTTPMQVKANPKLTVIELRPRVTRNITLVYNTTNAASLPFQTLLLNPIKKIIKHEVPDEY